MKLSWQQVAVFVTLVAALTVVAVIQGDPGGLITGALIAGWRYLDKMVEPRKKKEVE
jgi:hypothetical protein